MKKILRLICLSCALSLSTCFAVEPITEEVIRKIIKIVNDVRWAPDRVTRLTEALQNPANLQRIIPPNLMTRLQQNNGQPIQIRPNELNQIQANLNRLPADNPNKGIEEVAGSGNDRPDDNPGAGAVLAENPIDLHPTPPCQGVEAIHHIEPPFSGLPMEIWDAILSFLTIEELLNLIQIVKAMTTDEMLQGFLDKTHPYSKENAYHLQVFKKLDFIITALQEKLLALFDLYRHLSLPPDDPRIKMRKKLLDPSFSWEILNAVPSCLHNRIPELKEWSEGREWEEGRNTRYEKIIDDYLKLTDDNKNLDKEELKALIDLYLKTIKKTNLSLFFLFIYWCKQLWTIPLYDLVTIISQDIPIDEYLFALINLWTHLDENFRRDNPFFCVFFDQFKWHYCIIDMRIAAHNDLFPYTIWKHTAKIFPVIAKMGHLSDKDHLGYSALCYVLKFLIRVSSHGSSLINRRHKNNPDLHGRAFIDLLAATGADLNCVTQDGLTFVEFAETLLRSTAPYTLDQESYELIRQMYSPRAIAQRQEAARRNQEIARQIVLQAFLQDRRNEEVARAVEDQAFLQEQLNIEQQIDEQVPQLQQDRNYRNYVIAALLFLTFSLMTSPLYY